MEPLYNYPGSEVPLEHMDYSYVSNCSNIKELGKILKALRSGKEGHYPELIAHTENRLAHLDPTNKLLIKNKPAARMSDLPQDEFTAIKKDIEEWETSVSNTAVNGEPSEDEPKLPPVRSPEGIDNTTTPQAPTGNGSSQERLKSYDFDGWSKFNVEEESAKVDSEVKSQSTKPSAPVIPIQLSEQEMRLPESEKVKMADKEREKGNEAYRAGDHEEALVYYTRSLNFRPSVAAFNNRALTEIKLKQFQAAIDDCTKALKIESTNTKALFRRGTAFAHLNKEHQAATDFERVLHFEPNNKKAQQELSAVRQKLSEGQKVKKKRIIIEEVEQEVGETTPTESTDSSQDNSESVASSDAPLNQPKPVVKPPPPALPAKVQELKESGNAMFKSGNYGGALEKYTQAIDRLTKNMDHAQDPNLSMLLNNRAACQLKIGNCPAAIEDCTQSLSLVPVNVKALMRRAQAYEHSEKYKRAYNDYQLALSIDRSLNSAYEASSRITRLLRDLEGNNWRDKLPEVKEAALIRETLLASQQSTNHADSATPSVKDADSATLSVKDADSAPPLVKDADSATPLVKDAESTVSEEPVPQVVSTSNESITASEPIDVTPVQEIKVTQSTPPIPSPRPATPPQPSEELLAPEDLFEKHKLKGNEHIKKGEYVEALRYYSLCVDACPDNVVGYTNRALCHLRLDSPSSAEDDCTKALSLDARNVKALYRRGLARKALNRYAESVKDLHQLTIVDPDNATARKELGEVKQLWEKQLRELQAMTAGKKDTRPERKTKSTKSAKKATPSEAADASLQNIHKLLEEIKASKERMEEMSKPSPGSAEAPKQSNGRRRASPTLRTPPSASPAPHTTKGASPTHGKKASKTKTKKVPKKPTKVPTKEENPKPTPESVKKSEIVKEKTELKAKSSPAKQEKKTKRIVIEEDNSSGEGDKGVETTPLPVTPSPQENEPTPQESAAPLRTPFEFVQRWNAIPRSGKSSEYARLLEAIAPSSLPSVVTTKLDGMMLTNIIRAIDKQFIPKGKYELSVDILTNLSKVPRFGMIAMFMSPQEKSDLNTVLSAMAANSVPASSIEEIRKLYTLD